MAHHKFDPERAILGTHDTFKPFRVKKTISLKEAVDKGKVKADTDLLLLNHPDEPLALMKSEMAYHHAAQGEIAGEPYLVSF